MTLTVQHLSGRAIGDVIPELAALRTAVFRDFPYLYEGSLAYEENYLSTYVRSERSLLMAVYDGAQLVGATTALPLIDETNDVQEPFRQAGYDLDAVFYFGESILLPAYRGQGLGHRFFDAREAHARQFDTYRLTCFCAVQRPADHPLRPADYRSLDAFWTGRGYRLAPELRSTFWWPDLGETVSTPKSMTYWTKELT